MSNVHITKKLRREIAAQVAANKHEIMEDGGFYLGMSKLIVGGAFQIEHRRGGELIHSEGPRNIVVNEGLSYLLGVALHGDGQITAWYIALFAGNITPAPSMTAANFTATATEFTNYVETTRQVWTPGTVANQAVDNSAAKAAFNIDVGGGTVYGAALISAAAKSAITGKLFAAARFAASRALLQADTLNAGYGLVATST